MRGEGGKGIGRRRSGDIKRVRVIPSTLGLWH